MQDNTPYHNYRLTVRIELKNSPGMFAKLVNALTLLRVNLGAVDLIQATKKITIRDITIDVANEKHGYEITKKLAKMAGIKIISISDQIFLAHLGGKISVQSKLPLKTRNRLAMVYTPGVGRVVEAIAKYPEAVHNLTIKSNSVAVISDGSAILGLGNLGASAAIPVMEGKVMIFKEFANIDAWPICLDTQDENEIIQAIKLIAPVFGAINLEDISAPRCFRIEEALKKELSIPVMHDDQHGTAVVVLAALKNALKLIKKDLKNCKVVVSGLGSAGLACCRILLAAGVKNLYGADKKGVVLSGNANELRRHRQSLHRYIQWDKPTESLKQALKNADVFIGLSVGNILNPRDLKLMKKNNIVFALANPTPEIDPNKAFKHCRVFATGRSDFPNQINNALVFPGIFRGALDVKASKINEPMKLAAANALAKLITPDQLSPDYIIPNLFDKRVVSVISQAVARAAIKSDVAKKKMTGSPRVGSA